MSDNPETSAGEVTQLLDAAREGDRDAFDRLFPLVLQQLRQIARKQLRAGWEEAPPTEALVNEAYLKLLGGEFPDLESRVQFFGVASRAMRQVLIDRARKLRASKRGGEWARTSLSGKEMKSLQSAEELLALNAALTKLAELDERLARVVECRFFGGMTEKEIGQLLGVSAKTVRRDWAQARAWLHSQLTSEGGAAQR